MKKSEIRLAKVNNDQIGLKPNVGKIGKGNKKNIQMLQRLPIAPVQVKAGNDSENSLKKMREIVYSLNQSQEITKKVYNNIIKLIQI